MNFIEGNFIFPENKDWVKCDGVVWARVALTACFRGPREVDCCSLSSLAIDFTVTGGSTV